MCRAANIHLFTTVIVTDQARNELAAVSAWAGGDPPPPVPPQQESRGPIYGPLKALELKGGDYSRDFEMTPLGNTVNARYRGGVRRMVGDFHYITSGSAWAEDCDALFALVLSYAMDQEVRFHHVGFGYPSEEAMMEATRLDAERLGVTAKHVPAADHLRYYLHVDAPEAPNRVYWREHQYGPTIRPNNIHWDLATMNPVRLLTAISTRLPAAELELWDDADELNGAPVGAVWVPNRDGKVYGIMARSKFVNMD